MLEDELAIIEARRRELRSELAALDEQERRVLAAWGSDQGEKCNDGARKGVPASQSNAPSDAQAEPSRRRGPRKGGSQNAYAGVENFIEHCFAALISGPVEDLQETRRLNAIYAGLSYEERLNSPILRKFLRPRTTRGLTKKTLAAWMAIDEKTLSRWLERSDDERGLERDATWWIIRRRWDGLTDE